MNKKLLFSAILAMTLPVLVSCDDNDDVDDKKYEAPYALYVLNEGSWGKNNASISGIAPGNFEGQCDRDIYSAANGKALGDVVAPYRLRQGILVYHTIGTVEEIMQNVVLLPAQLELLLAYPHLEGIGMQTDIAHRHTLLAIAMLASEDTLHPSCQLSQMERLRQIIVGTQLQS